MVPIRCGGPSAHHADRAVPRCRYARRRGTPERHRPDGPSDGGGCPQPSTGRARSARSRRRPARCRSAGRPRACGRSRRWRSRACSSPPGTRRARRRAASSQGLRSDCPAGTVAGGPSRAPRRVAASATPASGSWPACRAQRRIAAPRRPRPRRSAIGWMLLRSPGPISPATQSRHMRCRALCQSLARKGASQRSGSPCQSVPTASLAMIGPQQPTPHESRKSPG